MKYARVTNNVAVEVIEQDVYDAMPENGQSLFVEVPEQVERKWVLDGDTWSAPEPVPVVTTPQPLTRVQFVRLCMSAGGMTQQMLVDSKADPQLAALWMIMDMATHLEKDDPEIAPGLTALETLGYLPNGADAVLNAWPEV